ncbi:MAG: putative molybdenum carrier protein [Methylococcales bacterium]
MKNENSTSTTRVISGGQTGVDRAALDAAIDSGLLVGGWCPKGRRAEDGKIDSRYPLRETDSKNHAVRTHLNVRDSDGTLILIRETLHGGSLLTRRYAEILQKKFMVLALEASPDLETVVDWLTGNAIFNLNVAGPREGNEPGIYAQSYAWLQQLFRLWKLNRLEPVGE